MSGVSPSAPGEQVLYHAVWGHAQGLEGPSPGVQRGAAGGRPRRSSLELSYGANHDRPLIVVVLSHSWGRARRYRTEHASHPMDRAEDLIEGLHPDGLASAGPGRPDPALWIARCWSSVALLGGSSPSRRGRGFRPGSGPVNAAPPVPRCPTQ